VHTRAAGTQVHAVAQEDLLAPRKGGTESWWREAGPDIGNLNPESLTDLLEVRRRHAATGLGRQPQHRQPTVASCWAGWWASDGRIGVDPVVAPVVVHERGSALTLVGLQSPNGHQEAGADGRQLDHFAPHPGGYGGDDGLAGRQP